MTTEKATFGAGCFWGVEATFRATPGVTNATVGYAGGTTESPTYDQVCAHNTGHAEVVQVTYDPSVISTEKLLHVFFELHDPTTLNRQGADVGTQYRSAIFYHDEQQKKAAEELIQELNAQKIWDKPIVTQVETLDKFYMAEDYHQEYFVNNKYQPYCMAVVAPKVSKFRKHFLELLKKQPV